MVYEQDSTPFLFEDESGEEEKVDEVEKVADDEEEDEAVE